MRARREREINAARSNLRVEEGSLGARETLSWKSAGKKSRGCVGMGRNFTDCVKRHCFGDPVDCLGVLMSNFSFPSKHSIFLQRKRGNITNR